MDKNNERKINASLQQIAKQEGITEEEVRNEIAYAISLALKNDDPKVQEFWKQIPTDGDSPTVEEVINYIILKLTANETN